MYKVNYMIVNKDNFVVDKNKSFKNFETAYDFMNKLKNDKTIKLKTLPIVDLGD